MSDNEREYWIAGGNDLDKANLFMRERKEALAAMTAIGKKYGGSSATNGHRIVGLTFDGEPPLGWARKGYTGDGRPVYFPRKVTKAGKEIAKELDSIKGKTIHSFHALYSNDGGVIKDGTGRIGMRVFYISWEVLGDMVLLSVPIGCDFKPDGSTLLKMSEYWALKEATPIAA